MMQAHSTTSGVDVSTRAATWASHATCVAGGALGAVAFAASLGLRLVDPQFVTWTFREDWSLNFFGWHLFRAGSWEWPLGATPLLRAPVGSSIGLTDSIPLLAFPLKLLHPWLPPAFQYLGLWILLSFILQGFWGVLLMRLVTNRPMLQLLGAALLVMSPPLLFRINHTALTAHWLLLAALWVYFAQSGKPLHKLLRWWALIGGCAAATQPYLFLMVASILVASYARRIIIAPRQTLRACLHFAALSGMCAFLLWQCGYFIVEDSTDLGAQGLGLLSLNLLAPFVPLQRSTLLPDGPIRLASQWQYEGYAYLGAGMLLLGIVAVTCVVVRAHGCRWRRSYFQHLPFVAACAFLTAVAVSPVVTFGSWTLFTYDPRWWGPLTVYRSSGRMFWPVFYTINLGILTAVVRLRYRYALPLLTMAVGVQAVDVSDSYRSARQYRDFEFHNPLQDSIWIVAPPHYKHLVLVPSNLCDWQGIFDHTPFSLLAGQHHMSINAGMVGRSDSVKVTRHCEQMRQEWKSGAVSAEKLYVLRPELVSTFRSRSQLPLVCTVADGYGVCAAAQTYVRWQQSYDVVRAALPPAADFLRFHQELDDFYRDALQRGGIETYGRPEDRAAPVAGYLAYRAARCDHAEAQRKSLAKLRGENVPPLCSQVNDIGPLPPTNETFAFRRQLETFNRDELGKPPAITHVDLEGEAVWIHAYAAERLRGRSASEARDTVFQAIRQIVGR